MSFHAFGQPFMDTSSQIWSAIYGYIITKTGEYVNPKQAGLFRI